MLTELWAGASPQHRMAARKPLFLDPRRVVLTIGALLNKGTVMLSRQDDHRRHWPHVRTALDPDG
jgi:hypothetical protein